MKKMLTLAALACLALPGAGRADRLDSRLLEEAPKLVEKLKAKKYENVGVLRFQVDMPGKKPSFTAPLSGNLVSRLETGLIIHVDNEGKPAMGVIRDAGAAAGRANVGSWSTDELQRRKLFTATYPLAWGRATVKADAFITGKVVVSKDFKKTTMTVQSFDKDAPARMVTLASFTIPTDRNLLRDLGLSFSLPSAVRARHIGKGAKESEVDSEVIETVEANTPKDPPVGKDDPPPPVRKTDTRARPDDIGGVSLRMLSGTDAVPFREKATEGDGIQWEMESPAGDKEISFELKNNGKKRVAVVLKVNGLNIVNMQKDAPENCRKIILEPGKRAVVRGFIMDEPGTTPRKIKKNDDDLEGDDPPKKADPKAPKFTRIPFTILVGEEARKAKADLGDKAGLVEVDVFEEGSTESELQVTPRGLPPTKDKVARETYKGLRTALLQSSGLKTKLEDRGPGIKARELIVPRPAAEREEMKASVKEFPNPSLVSRVAIRIVPREEAP